eukprot:5054264-Pyramimonas_sp.AAC.1
MSCASVIPLVREGERAAAWEFSVPAERRGQTCNSGSSRRLLDKGSGQWQSRHGQKLLYGLLRVVSVCRVSTLA